MPSARRAMSPMSVRFSSLAHRLSSAPIPTRPPTFSARWKSTSARSTTLNESMRSTECSASCLSIFHTTHGFYVHGLPIEGATLPPGWRSRVIKVQNMNTRNCIGWCLAVSDLAVSKLVAFREKDRVYIRAMLRAQLIAPRALIRAIRTLPRGAADQSRLATWVTATVRELSL
jgi:hypothetical protein